MVSRLEKRSTISDGQMQVYKSFFQIGIYDPVHDDSWPWHCHYEDGQYLSAKKRICSWNKPAEFETAEAARLFYHSWKHKEQYKMELIEVKRWTEIPDPEYSEDHPREIFNRILRNETSSRYKSTASLWFSGYDPLLGMSRPTRIKHRNVLLKYGIDIIEPPSQIMLDLWSQTRPAVFSNLEFQSKSTLTVVK